ERVAEDVAHEPGLRRRLLPPGAEAALGPLAGIVEAGHDVLVDVGAAGPVAGVVHRLARVQLQPAPDAPLGQPQPVLRRPAPAACPAAGPWLAPSGPGPRRQRAQAGRRSLRALARPAWRRCSTIAFASPVAAHSSSVTLASSRPSRRAARPRLDDSRPHRTRPFLPPASKLSWFDRPEADTDPEPAV